jgi:starch phosphorylase
MQDNGNLAESIKGGFAHNLKYALANTRKNSTRHDLYLALAMTVRDKLIDRWHETREKRIEIKGKRAYYLSLEFLIGRAMGNNVINLGLEGAVRRACEDLGLNWDQLREEELDAGLGNGGLGRLAACFLDSLATLEYPAIGYGLRYDYGIFRQRIVNGYQTEDPDDWLSPGNPWEIVRTNYSANVGFGGHVEMVQENGRTVARWTPEIEVVGIPYDMPIVGYGGVCVNILRLWSARASQSFRFDEFNQGDYELAVHAKTLAENLTKVLYPNDLFYAGQELRLRQEYFFVACSLHDILRRFKIDHGNFDLLPDKIAVQLNDTHPSLAVPELMRLLVDGEKLDWDRAWDLTVRSLGYTNHTLMPEALEKWPVEMFERLLPRHMQIVYEINRRFLEKVAAKYPGDEAKLQRMSLIQEGGSRHVRMAYLSIVGSHSTNGVAALHTELLKKDLLPDFYAMFPERFNNKTNGVTPRRWLLKANPGLAHLITESIGNKWITDLSELRKLAPLAEDPLFRKSFRDVKRAAKVTLADYVRAQWGMQINPDSLIDSQVKRLHEYKRQLLNALHIVIQYNRLRKNPSLDMHPRTFLFAAKAAPGYAMAKLIIKFINNLGHVINNDPVSRTKLQVQFLPNYQVSLAEKIIPASDVSEQISLAGMEASGTGNMKFMMNGAITVGTLDGANVEMLEEVGKENIFIFGLTAQQVAESRGYYNPQWHHEHDVETREAIDLISSGHFNKNEGDIFRPILDSLLKRDQYMHLADLTAYAQTHERVERLYCDKESWSRKAILNVAYSGKFSSDRTIQEYAREVWQIKPVPIDIKVHHDTMVMMAKA